MTNSEAEPPCLTTGSCLPEPSAGRIGTLAARSCSDQAAVGVAVEGEPSAPVISEVNGGFGSMQMTSKSLSMAFEMTPFKLKLEKPGKLKKVLTSRSFKHVRT